MKTITKDRQPKDIPKLLERLIPLIAKNLVKADQEAMLTALFERSGAEMLRLTGMDELLSIFDEKELEKIQQLQEGYEQATDLGEKVEIQITIASFLNRFIYSEEYFPHQDNSYKPSEIATGRYLQCMTKAFMQYTLWHKYFGTEIIGCFTDGHFFAILPLDDGSYLSLDCIPKLLRDSQNKPLTKLKPYHPYGSTNYNGGQVFCTGTFPGMYMGGFYSNKSNDYRNNPQLAAEFYLKSIELSPNNFGAYYNLANLYKDNFQAFVGEHGFDSVENVLHKAAKLYLKAIEINPNYFAAYNNLANLYKNNLQAFVGKHGFDSAEDVLHKAAKLYLKAIPEAGVYQQRVKLSLAYLYNYTKRQKEALKLFNEVLTHLNENNGDDNIPLWLTKEELKGLISNLETILS